MTWQHSRSIDPDKSPSPCFLTPQPERGQAEDPQRLAVSPGARDHPAALPGHGGGQASLLQTVRCLCFWVGGLLIVCPDGSRLLTETVRPAVTVKHQFVYCRLVWNCLRLHSSIYLIMRKTPQSGSIRENEAPADWLTVPGERFSIRSWNWDPEMKNSYRARGPPEF